MLFRDADEVGAPWPPWPPWPFEAVWLAVGEGIVPLIGVEAGPAGMVKLATAGREPKVGGIVNIVESMGTEKPVREVKGNVPFPDVV